LSAPLSKELRAKYNVSRFEVSDVAGIEQ